MLVLPVLAAVWLSFFFWTFLSRHITNPQQLNSHVQDKSWDAIKPYLMI